MYLTRFCNTFHTMDIFSFALLKVLCIVAILVGNPPNSQSCRMIFGKSIFKAIGKLFELSVAYYCVASILFLSIN